MAVSAESAAAVPPLTAGLILAGGRARRMGGQDKGLLPLAGKPLIEHALERLRPQVHSIVVSANRSQSDYQRYGYPVLSDDYGAFAGPLAGILTALRTITEPWLVVVPCDSPQLPDDLVSRLHQKAAIEQAEVAVAHDGNRLQSVVALIRATLAPSLAAFLNQGGRKVELWYSEQRWTAVDFSDCPHAFSNINTPDDLTAADQRLAVHHRHNQ